MIRMAIPATIQAISDLAQQVVDGTGFCQLVFQVGDAHALLLHRIAVADGNRVVLKRLVMISVALRLWKTVY